MRVAALYDIHSNLPALEAVLDELSSLHVDHVVIGGDVIPGPMPSECLALLEALDVPCSWIAGNGEHDVLALHRGEEVPRVPSPLLPLVAWTGDELTAGQRQRLSAWPATVTLPVDGLGRVLFCHATPRDDNEIFTEWTAEEHLLDVFDPVDAPVVVCGHTHMRFDRMIGATRVVNAGSVGLPFGEPGASWVLLGPEVELRRTRYDLDAAYARISGTSYPGIESFDVRHPPGAAAMRSVFDAAELRTRGNS